MLPGCDQHIAPLSASCRLRKMLKYVTKVRSIVSKQLKICKPGTHGARSTGVSKRVATRVGPYDKLMKKAHYSVRLSGKSSHHAETGVMLLTDVQSFQHAGSCISGNKSVLRLCSRSFLGSRLRASQGGSCRVQRNRKRLCVRANELNKW